MLAVPALALAGSWPLATVLMIAKRTGRAIRRPAVETMVSYTGQHLGSGWVFGLNEALDQGGAKVGPFVVAVVLFRKGGYRYGFAILLIPALCCFGMLVVAWLRFPHPKEIKHKTAQALRTRGFSHTYWLYGAAGTLIVAGEARELPGRVSFPTNGQRPSGAHPSLDRCAIEKKRGVEVFLIVEKGSSSH